MDPAELRMKNLLRPEQFPYTSPTGWEYDSGDYPRALQLALRHGRLRRRCAREQAEKRDARRADGHRPQLLHRGAWAPAPASTWTSSASAWPTAAELRVHPTGKAVLRLSRADPGPGPRDDVRPDRRRRSSASRPRTSRWCTATPTTRRSGSAPTAHARRRCPAPRPPSWPRTVREQGAARRRGHAGVLARTTWSGSAGRWFVQGRPEQGKTIQEIAIAAHGNARAARRGRGPPRRDARLRPAEPHLPVRRLHLRGRRRPGHRPGRRCGGSSRSTTAAPASTR